ncbi:MAG: octaprenyl diphosphate synthase [Deltaproteobacteria bacterium RBG_16_48_10]|nr:MAG: octaprenyl diphosphate synthase [Deltaproteobacteria bacterium RBG_16_48_10]
MEKALELIREDLEKVDLEFRKNLQSDVSIISAIGEYLLLSGGKRFRPILLLLSAKLCGYQGDRHIPLASLVEFIHTATLLHDDVVDKAEIRRGNISANSKWGNEASVLVGDFLFTKSFSLLVEKGNWEIFQVLSRATTLMAEGELEELIRTDDLCLTEEGYLSIITRKTASLISATSQVGAILADVSEERKKALSRFGLDVGIAFQLMDDNLDYTSREEEFGKEIGIDLQRGKITLPLIHALRHCTPEEKTFVQETVDKASLTKEAFLRVVQIIERSHGIRYSCEKAKDYIDRAKRHLHLFQDSEVRQALFTLADYVIERKL